jgi:hypothetical protein
MAYTDIHDAAVDDTHVLRKQVAAAIAIAAKQVWDEDPATENHVKRMRWAKSVRLNGDQGPILEAASMIWLVLENATIQASPTTATDNDVQFVVNSLIDSVSEAL